MAGEQIMFFRKNLIDLSLSSQITLTVTDSVASDDGEDLLDNLRNRNNTSAWATTASTDAANTTLVADFIDTQAVSDIILIGHNFASYTLKYWNGVAWTNFSTTVSVSGNTETTNHHTFTEVQTSKIQLIITGTQTVNDDKMMKQWIISSKVGSGQLSGYPIIKSPTHSTNKKINRMLSGKVKVIETVGSFSVKLSVENWKVTDDLEIVEHIYTSREGVLMWICGGDEDQFSMPLLGYKKEDIYYVRPTNDYVPEFYKGLYKSGVKIDMKLEEAVD